MPQTTFPPNVPLKLIAKFEAAKSNMSELARRLEVNKGHISKLFKKGVEPRDKEIRKKLFLPARVREGIPAWVVEATGVLAKLERKANSPIQKRIYSRDGKRVR